jgi:hypothetical protein
VLLGTLPRVNTRSSGLLREIEAGALDSWTPIADVLRKVIAIGGRYHSPELRDWASRELNGYGPDDELPDYRKYEAQIIRLFWSVDPMALAGVVDLVRTALTALVAELVANIPPGAEAPEPEGAANAVQFAVTGKRNKVTFASAQGAASVSAGAGTSDDKSLNRWTITLVLIGVIVAMGAGLLALCRCRAGTSASHVLPPRHICATKQCVTRATTNDDAQLFRR